MGEKLMDNWSPDFRPRKWKRDKEQFAAWMDGADVRGPWKRRRFDIWRDEQRSERARVRWEAEERRRADLMANPSPELVAAYAELRAAEAASGARIGCARGGDMTNPETVRVLARLMNEHAEKFQ